MKRFVLAASLLFSSLSPAQVTQLFLAAGTPEDQAIQAALSEQDAAKRMALLNDFVQKFAANPMAAAYGNLQLAQQYQGSGDLKSAMAAAEKAHAAVPNNLDILVTIASVAQTAKDNAKAVEYAVKGAALVDGIAKQPKPEGTDDTSWASQLKTQREQAQQSYEFLEAAGYNAIASETDTKKRIALIDQFSAGFPKSRFNDQVSQYAMMSYQQANDLTRLAAYGEKALAADPNNISTLIQLANAFAEEQGTAHAAKAVEYAKRAIELAKGDEPGADHKNVMFSGVAHGAIGWVLEKQEKYALALPELQKASSQLKSDPNAHASSLYRLAFAYAKLNRMPEAKTTLTELLAMNSPFQAAGRDLMNKVSGAAARPAAAKAK